MERWVAVAAVLVVVAGCVTPAAPTSSTSPGPGPRSPPLELGDTAPSWQGETVPPVAPSALSDPPALTDHAALVYTAGNGASYTMHVRAATVMDLHISQKAGYVVEIAPKGPEEATRMRQTIRFGLDACMTPLWTWALDSKVPDTAFFLGDGRRMDDLPAFLVAPSVGAAAVKDMMDVYRKGNGGAPEVTPLPAGGVALALAESSGLSAAAWWYHPPTGLDELRAFGGVWPTTAPRHIPTWFSATDATAKSRFNLTGLENSGNLIPPCDAFTPPKAPAATIQITSRATSEDPPFAASLQQAIQLAGTDPSLQSYEAQHAGTYIADWRHIETASVGGVPEEGWRLTFAAPGDVGVQEGCSFVVPQNGTVAPLGCMAGSGGLDQPAANLDLSKIKSVPYAALLGMFKAVTGKPPCELDMTLDPFWDIGQAVRLRAFMRCDAQGLKGLWVDPGDGSVEYLAAPLPSLFTAPFAA